MSSALGQQDLQLCRQQKPTKLAAPKLLVSCQAVASPSATRVLLPPQLHPNPIVLERARQVPLMWRVVDPVSLEKPDPLKLMARIKGTTSWQEMQQVHSSSAADFNNTHACAAITHLAQLVCRLGPAALRGVQGKHATDEHDLELQHQDRLRSHQSASSSGNPQGTSLVGLPGHRGAWKGSISFPSAKKSRVQHTAASIEQPLTRTATPPRLHAAGEQPFKQVLGLSDTDTKLLWKLMQQVAASIKQCSMRQLANCIWALAKIEHATCHTFKASSAWIGPALAAAEQKMTSAEPQHLASIAYAFALSPVWLTYSKAPHRLLQGLFAVAHSKLRSFKPNELANLLWAAATLYKHQLLREDTSSAVARCLAAAVELASERADQLKLQELCNVLWAVGKLCGPPHKQTASQPGSANGWQAGPPEALLQQPSLDCMARLLRRADALLAELTPVGLASLTLSLGLLNIPWRLQQHVPTPGVVSAEQPGAVPGSASWVAAVLVNTRSLLQCSGPTELTSIIMGLAYMDIQPAGSWLKSWQDAAFAQLGSFSAQELANSTWALSCLSVPLSKQQLAQLLLASAARMPDFTAAEAAQLLPALADLECRPSTAWMELYCACVYDQLGSMGNQELAVVLAALARHRHCPSDAWLRRMTVASTPRLPRMPARTLAMLAHSFAVLGHQPHSSWAAHFMAATRAHLHTCSPRDCSSLLWSVAVLNLQPDSEWLAACLSRCELLAHGGQQEHTPTQVPVPVHPSREANLPVVGLQHWDVVTSGDGQPLHTWGQVANPQLWTPGEVSKMRWALVRLGYDPDASSLSHLLLQRNSDQWSQHQHPHLRWHACREDEQLPAGVSELQVPLDYSLAVLEGTALWVQHLQVAGCAGSESELVQTAS